MKDVMDNQSKVLQFRTRGKKTKSGVYINVEVLSYMLSGCMGSPVSGMYGSDPTKIYMCKCIWTPCSLTGL